MGPSYNNRALIFNDRRLRQSPLAAAPRLPSVGGVRVTVRLTIAVVVLLMLTYPRVAVGQETCNDDRGTAEPGHPNLYCVDLYPTTGIKAGGFVRMAVAAGPFGVAVTPDGTHRHRLIAHLQGLPEPTSLGPYKTFVAWAADPTFQTVEQLGPISNGRTDLGEIALNKFLVIISAESAESVQERTGRIVLRGQSPSNLLQPHDLLSQSPSAAFSPVVPHEHPPERNDSRSEESARHDHGIWSMPPMHPRVPMAPGMAAVRPTVNPFLPSSDALNSVPLAVPRRLINLDDGDTLSLTSALVRRRIGGRDLLMYGFNGQYPGPLIHVKQSSTIIVQFQNELAIPTAVHWHGIRLDNRFDGVPGITQEAVEPGASFVYQIHFPDAGIYWYHPHHREDIQQDLGLYGSMIVRSNDSSYFSPANREEVLMLDDLLVDGNGLSPYGRESANFMLMGRFGNVFLVNGEPQYSLSVHRREVVRLFLTNVSNTRTFNLHLDGARVKVVGSDIGKFEQEEWSRNVVIAPAERYIIDAQFNEQGTFALTNRVQALNHRTGAFFSEVDTLGLVTVQDEDIDNDLSASFSRLRVNDDVRSDIGRYRQHFDRPVDRELVMTLEVRDLPPVVSEMMRLDPVYFNPVEWSDTMPMMNWISTGNEIRWILRDPASGEENMEIDWRFRRGDVVKVRVRNDRNAFHAMQHPLHVHGQRFLVLERDGVANPNLVWKDTVLLPVGSETDLLIDFANPGKWMVHCHIAEHLESGMKMVVDVTE